MIKDTFFSLPRFMNLCRKEMVESWRSNVLRMVLMYGVMAVVLVWNGYTQYNYHDSVYFIRHANTDPAWGFILMAFLWFLFVFGCLSASLVMEKMKNKTSRLSTLMTPSTPFEKFFSRWLISTIVFLVVFLIAFKLADYTRVMVYSLIYPEVKVIAPRFSSTSPSSEKPLSIRATASRAELMCWAICSWVIRIVSEPVRSASAKRNSASR